MAVAADDVTVAFMTSAGERSFTIGLDRRQMSQRLLGDALTAGRFYEPVTSEMVRTILRPGDTAVIGGAHVGYFVLMAAACVGPAGRVIALEPEAANLEALAANCQANGFAHVDIIAAALSDAPGTAALSLNADNDGGHALWDVGRHFANPKSRAAPATAEVAVTTLDHVLDGKAVPSLVLLDVEGAETAAVRGGARLVLAAQVPYVIAEINILAMEAMNTGEAELRHIMTEAGYTAFGLFDGPVSAGATAAVTPLAEDHFVGQDGICNMLFATASGIARLIG